MDGGFWIYDEMSCPRRAEQGLAADGAIACFSSNLIPSAWMLINAPQLKASVMPLIIPYGFKSR
jgi:hypothetical protein